MTRGAALAAAILSVAACTLTGDDFRPVDVDVSSVQGTGVEVPDPTPPAPAVSDVVEAAGSGASCTDSTQCPAEHSCTNGTCVARECVPGEDLSGCAIATCLDGNCEAPMPCADGVRSPGETDVDCGGTCGPCAIGNACAQPEDCQGADCIAGVCALPTCTDGLRNQQETDVDCGGSCSVCGPGQACGADADCGTGTYCDRAARVCSAVSCRDGVQNGTESATDCGGGSCPGCPVGQPCTQGTDCGSGVCGANRLCSAPSCSDGVSNQGEADVDCGGPCAANCGEGEACALNADCTSGVCAATGCAAGVARCCQEPSCEDGVANGTEPQVDCGNAQCGRCPLGRACTADVQCQTGFCSGGTCQVRPLCGDGVRNGNEGDVDCGGTEAGCPRCGDGRVCRVDADCSNGNCFAGGCVSCADGVQNGDEAGIDCGGADSACAACPPRCNEGNSVDLQGVGAVVLLPANSCAKITQFPSYSPTRLDSFDIGPFPVPFSWSQECSGQQGTSTLDAAYQTRALPGLSIACPVILDFQGSAENMTVRWF